jgi:hypothetical protein
LTIAASPVPELAEAEEPGCAEPVLATGVVPGLLLLEHAAREPSAATDRKAAIGRMLAWLKIRMGVLRILDW